MNRIARVQQQLDPANALFVTEPHNVQYLCGYSGSFGTLIITARSATLLTDSRYELTTKEQCFDVDIDASGKSIPTKDMVNECVTVMFEKSHMTVDTHEKLIQALPQVTLVGTTDLIERFRLVKDDDELSHIRAAGRIATQALTDTVDHIRAGMTERQIQRLLESAMLECGADGIGFETIVASGPHSAIPHHEPTHRAIEIGDFIKIDFGAQVHGYRSDCTRTFVLGEPADWQISVYDQVRTAQSVGRSLFRAGASMSEINLAVRNAISDSEFRETFRHGLGHGVGLAIHEEPYFRADQPTKIEAGMVITIEPGIYLAHRGGVRIEDTLIATPTGYENVTEFSYDLISLG